ncbi:MAG: DEAD/DEAH box helicase family protein [Gammaproteobacteria bacterium]|nr:DEAD/DEAH box helicase family protein [Gammaproteobacteria bacterium]
MNTPLALSPRQLVSGSSADPLLPQLLHAIERASQIEIAVSFIQPSGLALLFEPLHEALQRGAQLQLLTSDYLDISHPQALRQLLLLAERGADLRIFQCDGQTAFHLKSYIFTRSSDQQINAGSAFIGSSNISKSALTQAYEWSWRHDWQAPADSPAALAFNQVRQAFAELLQHPQSIALSRPWIDAYAARRQQRLPLLRSLNGFTEEAQEEPTPNPVQMNALLALSDSRAKGYKRGLVVLATGIGKTWLAAFDVLQLQAQKVLFVAHREEILLHAQQVFAQVHPHASQGLLKGQTRELDADFVFASVQTLGKHSLLNQLTAGHFDYVIVDEFHHASAPGYRRVLEHFSPQFLLGLTATPERTDQADILALCDNNLIFENNMVQGINQKLLVPFHYYGIADDQVDYREIPWRNGRFDPQALEFAFATQKRARHVYQHWLQHKQSRTLGFCISQRHADYMADYFCSQGVCAAAVYSGSELSRSNALQQLSDGRLDVLFAVDLFNEGTDIPALDTLLMLRPTESKIIFLQQLGRGLRLSPDTGKSHVLVLDFIGNHPVFLNSALALFNTPDSKQLLTSLTSHAPLPLADGCHINYAPQLVDFWQQLKHRIGSSAAEDFQQLSLELGRRPTASEFFYAGYLIDKARKQHGSWLGLLHAMAIQNHDGDAGQMKQLLHAHGEFFLRGLETMSMTKSFKAILYKAFLQLDGLRQPVPLSELAILSRQLLERHPLDMQQELAASVQNAKADSKSWLAYWNKNPVNFSCQQDKGSSQPWFVQQDDQLALNFSVAPELHDAFADLFHELLDLRLAQYSQRKGWSYPPHDEAEVLRVAEKTNGSSVG